MTSLGFENYAEALKIYLSKYREVSFILSPLPGSGLQQNYIHVTNTPYRRSRLVERIKTDLQAADTMLVGQSVAQPAELQLLAAQQQQPPLDLPLQKTRTTYSLQT
jgi:hypothetical protein